VLRESGVASAEAMAYRDAHGRAMTTQDWSAIEAQLLRAYRMFKTAVQGGLEHDVLELDRFVP
jgi:hypothetical protein